MRGISQKEENIAVAPTMPDTVAAMRLRPVQLLQQAITTALNTAIKTEAIRSTCGLKMPIMVRPDAVHAASVQFSWRSATTIPFATHGRSAYAASRYSCPYSSRPYVNGFAE